MNPAPMNIPTAMPTESFGGGFLAGVLAKAHQGSTVPDSLAFSQAPACLEKPHFAHPCSKHCVFGSDSAHCSNWVRTALHRLGSPHFIVLEPTTIDRRRACLPCVHHCKPSDLKAALLSARHWCSLGSHPASFGRKSRQARSSPLRGAGWQLLTPMTEC